MPRLIRLPLTGLEPGRHVFFAICDHFEPEWGRSSRVTQLDRVNRWVEGYPRMVHGLTDSHGFPPQHTFFYPAEQWQSPGFCDHLAGLETICLTHGMGSVEVHLHHRDETEDRLRSMLRGFLGGLAEHRLLRNKSGGPSHGFVHGNWAFDNN